MPFLAIVGALLVIIGLLGLLNAVALSVIVSVVLLAAGVVLIVLDPSVRSRF